MTEQIEPMLVVLEEMTKLIELVAGYRAQAETAGFSPTAAERMAVELNTQLIQLAFKGVANDSRNGGNDD